MSSRKHRGPSYRPYAFTEQGVAMLSSVLRSPRAVEVNIAIMRTFVQLRRLMDSNRDLARRIESMEKRYDEQFASVRKYAACAYDVGHSAKHSWQSQHSFAAISGMKLISRVWPFSMKPTTCSPFTSSQ